MRKFTEIKNVYHVVSKLTSVKCSGKAGATNGGNLVTKWRS